MRSRAIRRRWCGCSPRSTAAPRRCSASSRSASARPRWRGSTPVRSLTWISLHRLRDRDRLCAADRVSRQQRHGEGRRRVAAQVRAVDRALRLGLGLSHRRAAPVERPERAGLRHCRDAARLDRDVASGGGHSGGVRRRHAADDRRRDHPLRPPSAGGGAADGGAGDRRHRLFPGRRAAPARRRGAEHFVSGGKGLAHRRARAGQAQFGRGAPPRRERQSRQVALPGDDEPRTAHAAQRDPRLLRSDEGRAVRSACRAGLQGIFQRHPRERPASPDAHQRNPRPVAGRSRALRTEGRAGLADRRGRGMSAVSCRCGSNGGISPSPKRWRATCRASGRTSARCAR